MVPMTITETNDLASTESIWRELERSGVCSPYQRFDWVKTYAHDMMREGAEVRVLTIERAGHPVLLLPLAIEPMSGIRIAYPMGGKHANYHCPIMARGASELLDEGLL